MKRFTSRHRIKALMVASVFLASFSARANLKEQLFTAQKYTRICPSAAKVATQIHSCQDNVKIAMVANDCMKRLIALKNIVGPMLQKVADKAPKVNNQAGQQDQAKLKYETTQKGIQELVAIIAREKLVLESYQELLLPDSTGASEDGVGYPISDTELKAIEIQSNISNHVPCYVRNKGHLEKISVDIGKELHLAQQALRDAGGKVATTETNRRDLANGSINQESRNRFGESTQVVPEEYAQEVEATLEQPPF